MRFYKWRAIALLALAEAMAMSLWFAGSAVLPAWRAEFGLEGVAAALVTSSVSAGFVAGTLLSAFFGLADRIEPRRFFFICALFAGAANFLLLYVPVAGPWTPALRFAVGLLTAGIYPVGMKMAATWAEEDRGLLVGLLVGALTLGSALPHLLDALADLNWRHTIVAASALAWGSGLLILAFRLGPRHMQTTRFKAGMVLVAWRDKALRYANLGYLGHMWELYAMWGWIGVFLAASLDANPGGPEAPYLARLLTFATIAIGALSCLWAGHLADRYGRTLVTIAAMLTSGACALVMGHLFAGPVWLIALFCLLWGASVIADSAQFSASVIELAPPGLSGTMLTLQTSVGFLLTMLTIHLVPEIVAVAGWAAAFGFLAIGPLLGAAAMARLRGLPAARKMAGGRR